MSGSGIAAQDLVAADQRLLWHPFTQTEEWLSYQPLIVDSADGFFLIDHEGRRYLDGVSSIWCNVHGHDQAEITRALHEQIDRVCHSTLLGLSHRPAIELAERLVAITPDGLDRVFYSDSGSTAVEVAIRMAFQYWRQTGKPGDMARDRFITLREAYHGDTLGSVSLGRSSPFHIGYEAITFEVEKFAPPYLCQPINGHGPVEPELLEAAGANSLAALEETLEANRGRVAAVVIEPLVQGAAGIWPQPVSFLSGLRRLCDSHGILMVADEVATGFGRTGTMFACEQAGISPDIMCLAKGLTAGYLPLAATLASGRVFEAFSGAYSEYRTLFHGHTYGGNPLGCAAAIANLEVFEHQDTLATANERGQLFGRLLDEHIVPLAHAGPPRRVGMMAAFDILRNTDTGQAFGTDERRGNRAVLEARKDGLIIRPLGDTMVLMPPLNIPPELLGRIVETTATAVARATSD